MTNNGISRRGLFRSIAVGTVAAAAISSNLRSLRAQAAPKTFVLVHGAWCGSWTWRRVADQLEAKGHKVFVPTLTGLGERSHLLRKDVDLDTHIADVANLIKWESLSNVCLVLHSYAGFVGAGALETIGGSVASAVWVDAQMPSDGQRMIDLTAEGFRKQLEAAHEKGEIGFGATGAKIATIFVNERDEPFVRSKLTPQPIATYLQPVKLTGAREKLTKKTYIRTPKFPQPALDKAFADCRADKSWSTFELPETGHMAMIDVPERLTELLLQSA
jgi:pimeloyl-ACP methyl ester carboxylesterase